jgi:hypothetical protein
MWGRPEQAAVELRRVARRKLPGARKRNDRFAETDFCGRGESGRIGGERLLRGPGEACQNQHWQQETSHSSYGLRTRAFSLPVYTSQQKEGHAAQRLRALLERSTKT